MNTFGTIYRLTSFGESHGAALGGVVDGIPAGVKLDIERINRELARRRPGQSAITTSRRESDTVRLLSGTLNDVTTGTPIGFIIENTNQRSADYSNIEHTFRPSHADFTYTAKYGLRDYRGGGRSSARETVSRCVAGAIARQVLEQMFPQMHIYAYTSTVGNIDLPADYTHFDPQLIDSNAVRCPHAETAAKMQSLIESVMGHGDTIGGAVTGVITGVPVGLGEPVFDKLQARLAAAMMSINAAKGFEYGMGFEGCRSRGSDMLDRFTVDTSTGAVATSTNHSGGIQGGISNGSDIYFRVAFKPVATLLQDVDTIDDSGNEVMLKARGRHDPCVLPRAVPIVEAMAAMVMLDMALINRTTRL